MGNIKNYTFNKLDFKLSNSDYWDFYLNNDAMKNIPHYSGNSIASFDFSDYTTFGPDFLKGDFLESDFNTSKIDIISTSSWIGAYSGNFSATTFGLTGIDNGSIIYNNTDDYVHTELLSALTGTTLIHTSADTKLSLKQVSGSTGNLIYPIELIVNPNSNDNHVNLCGGFFQGYYKLDGYDYQTLPNRYEKGWTISTSLKPDNTICNESGSTLNDTHVDTDGFFFYMGARAENKFWNIFTGNTSSGCTSGSTDICMDIKETDIMLNNIMVGTSATTLSVPLSPPPYDIELITNGFLIFGRSGGMQCDGDESADGFGQVRVVDYDADVPYYSKKVRKKQTDFQNAFLTFGRSGGMQCDGDESADGFGQIRVADYTGSTSNVLELDKDKDIIDNAIGFRIRDDGSIGYRLLTLSGDCKSVEVVEEYSASGTVISNEWSKIVVKWINNGTYDKCDLVNSDPRKGRFKFYVNSMLIFTSKELTEIIPNRLDDLQEKQIGVPYNISIGGGTQGLTESMTFDGQDASDLGLIIENNFAGTFIGSMKYFNLYDKSLSWCEIKDI